ncbi:MAG: molybdopterin-dependent oxidoreductase [Thermomicrobiales bacterium]
MTTLLSHIQRLRFGAFAWLALLAAAVVMPAAATLAQSTPVASPVAAGSIEITGLVTTPGPLSVADMQALPTETVSVTFESGGTPEDHTFTGVRLYDALEHIGFAVDPDARNPLLTMYLVITANDGYQVVLSGGEIDPNFGNAPILLAWEQDDAPLAGDAGPLRLVVPGDLRGGRYVHGIVSIDVRTVAETK